MKKVLPLILLALALGACQLFNETTPTLLPPTQTLETEMPTPEPMTATLPATQAPALSLEEILAGLPFTAGPQPNGSFVVQEIQRADLTGDGREDVIVISRWKQNEAEEFAVALQVDIVSAEGAMLTSTNTWEELGSSPSTMELDEYSFLMFNQIETVDIVSLTGEPLPQAVVRIRYSGTGSILEAHILSFKDGVATTLSDIVAYKGWMEYQRDGYMISQPLYLYNEPNCCPCRTEKVAYTWDGAAFTIASSVREAIEGMDCPAFPTPGEWRALSAAGGLPPARRNAAMVYDAIRGRLVLFGGRRDNVALSDTWAFDLESSTWAEIVPAGATRPPARHSMVAGPDAMRQQMVITMGEAGPNVLFNDVWVLNLETNTWSQLLPSGVTPAPRYGAAGGIPEYSDSLLLTHGFTHQGGLDDTWILDLETVSWRNVTPPSALPLVRFFHGAAPLSWTQLTIFGGCSSPVGTCPQDDTWIFQVLDGSWQRFSGSGPAPRQQAGMVAMGDRGSALLFGGLGEWDTELDDVWIFDRIQGGWRQITLENSPAPRQGHSMAWMSYSSLTPGGAVAVFGGASGGAMLNDLWVFIPWDE